MKPQDFKSLIGHTDIYLIDQILKGTYQAGEKLLDAGCGYGRNLPWFIANDFDVHAVDLDSAMIAELHTKYPGLVGNIVHTDIDCLPFEDRYFDHVLCNAVLHFAEDTAHFKTMFSELVRVLNRLGTLFIRMTSNIGIESLVVPIFNGIYKLPDKSERFLLTRALLDEVMETHNMSFFEPLKTVNVDHLRCMTTLVLRK